MNGDALCFFDGKPEELALYEALETRIFSEIEDVRLKVSKSQISFYNRHLFACVSFLRARRKAELPAHYIVLTLGLDRPLDTPGRRWSLSPTPIAGPTTSSSPAKRR